MLSVTECLLVQRCCSYKLACVCISLILVLGTSIPSVIATDACNGRCRQFENVYCNSGTGVCDDCSIYCSSMSLFYDQEKCDKLCSKEPVSTDACANRCIDFPDTYCNSVTGSCDSCSIFCSEASIFYNSTKCAIKCPGRMPTPTPTDGLVLSTTGYPVSTQTIGISPKPTTVPHEGQPEFKIETTNSTNSVNTGDRPMIVGIFIGSAVVCSLIIVLIYIIYRYKRHKRIPGTPQEEKRFNGDSEMVVGQGSDTTPLNSLESGERV